MLVLGEKNTVKAGLINLSRWCKQSQSTDSTGGFKKSHTLASPFSPLLTPRERQFPLLIFGMGLVSPGGVATRVLVHDPLQVGQRVVARGGARRSAPTLTN